MTAVRLRKEARRRGLLRVSELGLQIRDLLQQLVFPPVAGLQNLREKIAFFFADEVLWWLEGQIVHIYRQCSKHRS